METKPSVKGNLEEITHVMNHGIDSKDELVLKQRIFQIK